MPEKNLELLPFQKTAVQQMVLFLTSNPEHGVYNASEMGCGKTPMAIATCNVMNFQRILIICPAVMRLMWETEIKRWASHPHPLITIISTGSHHNLVRTPPPPHTPHFVITSYQLARTARISTALQKGQFDCLICDESHALKSTQSLQTEHVLRRIWPRIPYRICLSGTPMTQSIMDCYTTFHRLSPKHFSDYFKFANDYAYQEDTPYGPKYYGIKNHEKLRKIIRSNFFIRYEKKDVLPELPEKRWTRITLPSEFKYKIPDDLKPDYDKYLSLLKAHYSNKSASLRAPPTPPMHLMTIRRHQGMEKLPAIIEFTKNLVDQNIPVVLFGYHVAFIKELSLIFKSYEPAVIIGETSEHERALAINRFQNNAETNLFIGQYTAAGVGITLTRSSTVILGELDYSPSVINQGIDRCHRIGTKSAVDIYTFIVRDSIEEEIEKIVIEKAETFKTVMS